MKQKESKETGYYTNMNRKKVRLPPDSEFCCLRFTVGNSIMRECFMRR